MFPNVVNKWGLTIESTVDGTQPTTSFGTAVTPGNNAYGSYAQLLAGASVTDDCYEITILVDTVGISASARDCIVTIGIDAAGGTSYTDTIQHLLCSCATTLVLAGTTTSGGVTFRFPFLIKAGSSIAAKASVNSATVTAINVSCQLRARPSRPDQIKVGTYVDTYGATTASSSGTAITPGTVSEGAWTAIGTLTRPGFAWEYGYGINDSTMSNNVLFVDVGVGDASNKAVVIPNSKLITSTAESIDKPLAVEFWPALTGDIAYVRVQSSGTADSLNSVAVYITGG